MTYVVHGGPGGLTVGVSAVGARIARITGPSGREWLVPASRPEPRGRPFNFTEGTRGGWDECIPSIDPMKDPQGDGTRDITDHGDFWFPRWRVESLTDDKVVLDSTPVAHPLHLRKVVRVGRGTGRLDVDYSVTNRSSDRYRFLYSAHPLWSLPAGASLEVPGGGRVLTAFGFDEGAGVWPDVGARDVSVYPATSSRSATKVFVEWAGEVRATFSDGSSLVLRQPTTLTPWLGVCVNRRAWPPEQPGPDWIALEPTTSSTDSLTSAIADGSAYTLEAGETIAWSTTVEFSDIPASPATLNGPRE